LAAELLPTTGSPGPAVSAAGSLNEVQLRPFHRSTVGVGFEHGSGQSAPPAQALVLLDAVTSVNWLIPPLTPTVFAIRQPVLAA
jgi:hypothetical protein